MIDGNAEPRLPNREGEARKGRRDRMTSQEAG